MNGKLPQDIRTYINIIIRDAVTKLKMQSLN